MDFYHSNSHAGLISIRICSAHAECLVWSHVSLTSSLFMAVRGVKREVNNTALSPLREREGGRGREREHSCCWKHTETNLSVPAVWVSQNARNIPLLKGTEIYLNLTYTHTHTHTPLRWLELSRLAASEVHQKGVVIVLFSAPHTPPPRKTQYESTTLLYLWFSYHNRLDSTVILASFIPIHFRAL